MILGKRKLSGVSFPFVFSEKCTVYRVFVAAGFLVVWPLFSPQLHDVLLAQAERKTTSTRERNIFVIKAPLREFV
jgi:hypothetical protein